MAERGALIDAFVARAGWGGAARRALAGDASFRRYERLGDGTRRAVLMDAPPPEEVGPFLAVARLLRGLGYSAPDLLAAAPEAGLLLLEDFGDQTYTRLLEGAAPAPDTPDEAALYALAVDLLIDLHRRPAAAFAGAGLPAYDDARLLNEALLLVDWYLPALRGGAPAGAGERRAFVDLWPPLLAAARRLPETLVLRDYHVDNLIWLPGRSGLAACGLLDFQDAVMGPCAYDLISLLEDARRDIAGGLAAALRARYLAAFPDLDPAMFAGASAILAAQRNCKILGIFTRLWRRDGKPAYLAHIPRVWRHLEGDLADPALAPLRDWLDRALPPDARRAPEIADA